MKTVRARISGRVQGVWFRAWIEGEAGKHMLDGWVRNRRDGSVEALFHGPEPAVDRMLVACRIGPPAARVEDIAVFAAEAPERAGFTVHSSA